MARTYRKGPKGAPDRTRRENTRRDWFYARGDQRPFAPDLGRDWDTESLAWDARTGRNEPDPE